jgi:hypothetical protein
MLADDRITTFDWKRYNMYSCVFEPEKMSAEQLETGLATAYRNFYSGSRRRARFLRNYRGRETIFHLALSAANHNYAHRYKNPHISPEPGYEAAKEDISALMAASQAPAQEALNVAFLKAKTTVN